ncbi:MAG TPA: hypothetical protein VJX73_00415 [Terracidiphilus sp.]|nr:hypothetical protein [Terracidiphilus sp.]
MRILKYAFVVSAFMFIYIAIKFLEQPHQRMSLPMEVVITVAGLACALGGFVLPRFIFRAAERLPQNNSAEAQLKLWMAKGILSLAYFEACILFGLVLYVLGARVWVVELLFGVGIAAELFWRPGTPPDAVQENLSQN